MTPGPETSNIGPMKGFFGIFASRPPFKALCPKTQALLLSMVCLAITGSRARATSSLFCEERSAIEVHLQSLASGAQKRPIKTIFLFSIGGGSDTFSGLIPTTYLRHLGFKVFHFGVLSPTAHHFQGEKGLDQPEEAILKPSSDLQRAILTEPPLRIGNTETQLVDFARSLPFFEPDTSFLLSAKRPPSEMANELSRLMDQLLSDQGQDRSNALVIAADFGADILSRGEASTISPDLDAIVLRQLIELPDDFTKLSWLFWPGVDGELSPEDLREKFEALKPHILASSQLSLQAQWMLDFDRLFKTKIAHIRAGNTIPLSFEILKEPTQNAAYSSTIKKKFAVGDQRLQKEFPIRLDPALVRTSYLIDIRALFEHNPFAQINAIDALDFFLQVQKIYRTHETETAKKSDYVAQNGSDYLLQYLRLGSDGRWTSREGAIGPVLNIAITPASLDPTEKAALLNAAISLLENDRSTVALFLEAQIKDAHLEERFQVLKEQGLFEERNFGDYRALCKSQNTSVLKQLEAYF